MQQVKKGFLKGIVGEGFPRHPDGQCILLSLFVMPTHLESNSSVRCSTAYTAVKKRASNLSCTTFATFHTPDAMTLV